MKRIDKIGFIASFGYIASMIWFVSTGSLMSNYFLLGDLVLLIFFILMKKIE